MSIMVTIISSIFLAIALTASTNDEFHDLEGICFFSVIIEFIYGIVLCYNLIKKKEKYLHLIPFLYTNWFIGCFCTNIFINIFENLPIWVYAVTFLFCFTCFLIYAKSNKKSITTLAYVLNGASITLIFYYALYLIPFSFFSVLGILALGLGFYGLVPAIVLVIHTVTLVNLAQGNRKNLSIFLAGMFTVFISLAIFTVMLNNEANLLRKSMVTKSFDKTDDDIPNYILISQKLKPNFLNEILLKKDIVYIATDNFFEFRNFNSIGSKQYNERKEHNPFLNIAYQFLEKNELSADDRISLLKSNFDKRLETEEQLWSGEDLITRNIKEDVKLFPKERLAYTEITMDVACKKESWTNNREAIYSFQLPEGSVATSLSLWVNGMERKGVLTTKEKAQAAYKQIVGVESRDPSLMQWKEGNRVVVRVFPITYTMPRTFKCGFTTPLNATEKNLTYKSIQIKGPNLSSAETLSRIQVNGDTKFESTKNFELTGKYYINKSKGLDQWQAVLDVNNETFSNAFVWKDKTYQIEPLEKQRQSFTPNEIVLDLNSNWTEDEIKELVSVTSKKFYVLDAGSKDPVNLENYKTVFSKYKELQYSLPQLFLIADSGLIITKCGTFSANFEELEETNYLKKLRKIKSQKLRVINIGDEINPFWQTIKEQHYVEYSKLPLQECAKAISENAFISLKTKDNRVNIESAGISINENPATVDAKNTGINHIYRMYAFGKVLAEHIAQSEDTLANNKYIYLAKDANIVTPVSSLIVLETDEDYTNNGIEKNINTLGNASIHNDGAVPEPHEWLMIVLGLTALFFYYKKQKNQPA